MMWSNQPEEKRDIERIPPAHNDCVLSSINIRYFYDKEFAKCHVVQIPKNLNNDILKKYKEI